MNIQAFKLISKDYDNEGFKYHFLLQIKYKSSSHNLRGMIESWHGNLTRLEVIPVLEKIPLRKLVEHEIYPMLGSFKWESEIGLIYLTTFYKDTALVYGTTKTAWEKIQLIDKSLSKIDLSSLKVSKWVHKILKSEGYNDVTKKLVNECFQFIFNSKSISFLTTSGKSNLVEQIVENTLSIFTYLPPKSIQRWSDKLLLVSGGDKLLKGKIDSLLQSKTIIENKEVNSFLWIIITIIIISILLSLV